MSELQYDPQVSVLMPVWNCCEGIKESFLRASIESILDQTLKDFEFVIVNDGSTDGTARVLEEYAAKDSRIKMITNPTNMKIAKALNIGLKHCSAPLVARQDADDMSAATRLEIEHQFLADRPETVLCGTGMYVIDSENRLLMEISHPCNCNVIQATLKACCPIVHGSVMFRKGIVESLGGYASTPEVEYAEDYDLWVRMAMTGHVIENIPERTLYYHRNHSSKSSSVHANTQAASTERIAKKARDMDEKRKLDSIAGIKKQVPPDSEYKGKRLADIKEQPPTEDEPVPQFDKIAARQCMLELKAAFDAAKVPFWLCFGTLLGAIRDKDIIDGDTDLDICCRSEDEDALCCLLNGGIKGFRIARVLPDKVSLHGHGWGVDIFLFRRTDQIQWMGNRDWPSYLYRCGDCYRLEDWRFDPVIWKDFLGEKFRILGDPVQYCTSRYNNWKNKSNDRAQF